MSRTTSGWINDLLPSHNYISHFGLYVKKSVRSSAITVMAANINVLIPRSADPG